jgi:hypothetical protein
MSLPPLPDPVQPTSANISRVKVNLENLQRFNDQLYTYTISKCNNAFALLTLRDDSDPGMGIGLDLLSGAITGICSEEFGIIGHIAAEFIVGRIEEYATSKPPSLLNQYSSYVTRTQSTSIQLDMDLAKYHSDPVTYWYETFSGTVNTPWGPQTYGCCLGQLAAIDFPPESDPLYMAMMAKAIYSYDQYIWWMLIKGNLFRNGWNSGYGLPPNVPASDIPKGDEGANNYCDSYMQGLPSHLMKWGYWTETDKKGRVTGYYTFYDYSLGWTPKAGKDYPISDAAANYLFIDTIPGVVVNPDGLFQRDFVFYGFGLTQNGF